MPLTIPNGHYFGFSKAELQAELLRYKDEVRKASSALGGASLNGQSFTFGPRRDLSLAEWQLALQDALAYFGAAEAIPGDTEVVRLS